VQLGIEGDDDAWIAIPAAPLADRAGFTILRETLHDWFPYDRHDVPQALRDAYGSSGDTPVSYLTALHNALGGGTGPKLRLRLLGSIECEQAAKAATDPPAGGLWPFRAERVIRAEDRFAWRDVTADPLALTSERRDTRDDRPGAAEYAAAAHAAGAHCTGGGRLVLRGIARAFRPGDAVPRTQGRRVNLSVDGPHRQCWPIITAVDYDFETGGKTELRLERPAGV
jgi:hypothetical protein